MNADNEVKVPAHVERFADILGHDGLVTFLLAFGGAGLYVPARPTARSRLVETLGRQKAEALGRVFGGEHLIVPTAKPFIARHLKSAKNMPTAEIARLLHTSDVTVRKYLAEVKSPKQLDLFG